MAATYAFGVREIFTAVVVPLGMISGVPRLQESLETHSQEIFFTRNASQTWGLITWEASTGLLLGIGVAVLLWAALTSPARRRVRLAAVWIGVAVVFAVPAIQELALGSRSLGFLTLTLISTPWTVLLGAQLTATVLLLWHRPRVQQRALPTT